MTAQETKIQLSPCFFAARERPFVACGELSASLFTFDSGVAAVRLKNSVGELIMLPFQGQQIWSAHFQGRELTMKSMFAQPNPTREYLQTYGGFYIHCGATAMGVPSTGDAHPLHGELPNAPYQKAWLVLGEDDQGAYLGLGGQYEHTVAFSAHYLAEPLVKLYAGSTLFALSMAIRNLKQTPMELMYLGHANFRPVDHGRLLYSARCTPESVRVRRSIPAHVHPGPGYREFVEELGRHPEKHHVLAPELVFDPELVFTIDYLADSDGLAHTLQVHPDGAADYLAHSPAQLNVGVRWICRTPDQDALGMILPATAGPEGYTAENAKGNIKTIPPQGGWRFALTLGALNADQAKQLETRIAQLVA